MPTKNFAIDSSQNTSGIINNGLIKVPFTNVFVESTNMTVSKKVANPPYGYNGETTYTIHVSFDNGKTYKYRLNDSPDYKDMVDGAIQLKDGQSANFIGVPLGVKMTVSEDAPAGFEVTYDKNSVVAKPNPSENIIHITNTYKANQNPVNVTIPVKKTIDTVYPNDVDHSFTFEIYENDNKILNINPVTITIPKVSTAQIVDPTNYQAVSGDGQFEFSIDSAGKYMFVIKEVASSSASNWEVDLSYYHYSFEVKDVNLDGSLQIVNPTITKHTADGIQIGAATIEFHNRYNPDSVLLKTALKGYKEFHNLSGVEAGLGGYDFKVVLTSKPEGSTVNIDSSVLVKSDNLTGEFDIYSGSLDKAGAYVFVIEEVEPASHDAAYTYTKDQYRVTINVANNNGVLSITSIDKEIKKADQLDFVAHTGDIIFTNDYQLKGQFVLSASKVFTNANLNEFGDQQFNFAVNQITSLTDNTPVEGNVETIINNTVDGKISFAKEVDHVGTYYYEISEVLGSNLNINYCDKTYRAKVEVSKNPNSEILDCKATYYEYAQGSLQPIEQAIFTNAYKPVSETINFTKTIDRNMALNSGDTYYFQLRQCQGLNQACEVIATEEVDVTLNNNEGNGIFAPLTFDQVGEYYYQVNEVIPTQPNLIKPGVIYDANKYDVHISVTRNGGVFNVNKSIYLNGDTTKAANDIKFINHYVPSDVSLNIDILKDVITDKGVNSRPVNDYQFKLSGTDIKQPIILTTDGKGNAAHIFTYTNADFGKTFTYHLEEVNTQVAGIEYSKDKYDIEVKVSDDNNGNLVLDAKYKKAGKTNWQILDSQFVFAYKNIFHIEPTNLQLVANKVMKGNELANFDPFTFELTPTDANGLPLANETVLTATNVDSAGKVDGDATFDITYQNAGTYYYSLKEKVDQASQSYIDFSKEEYKIVVDVWEEVTNNKLSLVAKAKYYKASDNSEVSVMSFTNTYKTINDSTFKLTILKELQGREFNGSDKFEFEVTKQESTLNSLFKQPLKATCTIDSSHRSCELLANQKVANGDTFIIKELKPANTNHIRYDETTYKVTIMDDFKGTLSAKVEKIENNLVIKTEVVEDLSTIKLTFVNKYIKPSDPKGPFEVVDTSAK